MATSARPVAPSKRRGEGQGRTAPQTFVRSRRSATNGSSALRVLLERLASEERQLRTPSEMLESPSERCGKAEAT